MDITSKRGSGIPAPWWLVLAAACALLLAGCGGGGEPDTQRSDALSKQLRDRLEYTQGRS